MEWTVAARPSGMLPIVPCLTVHMINGARRQRGICPDEPRLRATPEAHGGWLAQRDRSHARTPAGRDASQSRSRIIADLHELCEIVRFQPREPHRASPEGHHHAGMGSVCAKAPVWKS